MFWGSALQSGVNEFVTSMALSNSDSDNCNGDNDSDSVGVGVCLLPCSGVLPLWGFGDTNYKGSQRFEVK